MRCSKFLTGLMLITLTACANFGLQSPTTFPEKLAYAYGVHTAVLETASAEVTAGALTATDGNSVLRIADQARTLLDSAKVLAATDVTTAQGKLTLSVSILTQLQDYLQKHQPKGK